MTEAEIDIIIRRTLEFMDRTAEIELSISKNMNLMFKLIESQDDRIERLETLAGLIN